MSAHDTPDDRHVVVFGAGYTGMIAAIRAARRTRRRGVRVTLVNPSSRFTERLRMHQIATGQQLPDLRILPAHGPVAPSSYARVDELLAHHEERLDLCLASLRSRGSVTSLVVAKDLGWTRHERAFDELDVFSQGMAAMETKAHLDLLVARGEATAADQADGVVYAAVD